VKLTSTLANVFDANNKQMQDKDEAGFQSATAADSAPMTFTLHRK
jgi:hypothetical protein